MKIIIDRNTPDIRQSAVVEIDTKYCHYPYAIRESIELALKLDGYDERTIDEVFCRERVELKQEKGCVDCIDDTDYMSKEKYNQIIDEVWINYKNHNNDENGYECKLAGREICIKLQFIDKIKTDPVFSEKWGLKIEERELSLDERHQISISRIGQDGIADRDNITWHETYNKTGIPTKLITITYNNETIESYE